MLIIIIIYQELGHVSFEHKANLENQKNRDMVKINSLDALKKYIWDYLGIFPNEFLPEIHQSLRVQVFEMPSLHIRWSYLAPPYTVSATWMGELWGKTLGTHGKGQGRRWQGKKNYSKIIFHILIQAWDVQDDVEVGQGRQLGNHKQGSPLLSSLQRCPENPRDFSHKKSLKNNCMALIFCPRYLSGWCSPDVPFVSFQSLLYINSSVHDE